MFRSIKTRRIVLFLLLALIPPLFLRVVAYPRVINAFKAETEKHLKNAGIKQASLIEDALSLVEKELLASNIHVVKEFESTPIYHNSTRQQRGKRSGGRSSRKIWKISSKS